MLHIAKGATDVRIRCRVLDSTTGAPTESIAYNATGIAIWYQREGGAKTAISLSAGSGLTSAHSDGAWNEIDDGWYQVDSPDAPFATGVNSVKFGGSATGYVFVFEEVAFTNGTAQTGDSYSYLTTNLGTAGAAATEAGGTGDHLTGIPKTGYSLSASGLAAITAWTVNITGSLSGSVGSVTGAVGSVTSPVTVGTNNDKTGYTLSASGLAAISAWTVNITGSLSGSVGSVTAGVTVTTNNDKTNYILAPTGLDQITAWAPLKITGLF